MSHQLDLLRTSGVNAPIRFVVFVSYGNDSVALLQWAHESSLEGVAVVFTDTGWMADGWAERVNRCETWVKSIGFTPYRTKSIGFRRLAYEKQGFPTQQFQWCSYILKILPGKQWLEQYDPDARAICLVGVRREESDDRRGFPEYVANSANHGGRFMLAPMVDWTEEERDELIRRAGFEVFPSRSRECRCINSNRADMRRYTDADWAAISNLETEVGRTMYRPYRHMGAVGAEEVRKWANSERGQYQPPEPMDGAVDLEDAPDEPDMFGASGQCDTFGGCGR